MRMRPGCMRRNSASLASPARSYAPHNLAATLARNGHWSDTMLTRSACRPTASLTFKAAGIDATDDRRRLHEVETWLAGAGPTGSCERSCTKHRAGSEVSAGPRVAQSRRSLELASALYVQALTDQSKRAALPHEAAGLIEALPQEIRVLQDVQRWRARILEAPQRAAPRPRRSRSTPTTLVSQIARLVARHG
jgi:hypothetical protein